MKYNISNSIGFLGKVHLIKLFKNGEAFNNNK